MKRFRLYITVVVLAIAGIMTTGASAQVLRDADFNSIGRINGNGVVRDGSGRSAGSFDADGTVRNVTGTAMGMIKELEIFDMAGNRIGYINNDGKVTDAQKQTIGFARGVRVDWIACYYFFHMFER